MGDSILGYHAHMGGFDYEQYQVGPKKTIRTDEGPFETGLENRRYTWRLCEIGPGTVLNPGSVVGKIYDLPAHPVWRRAALQIQS